MGHARHAPRAGGAADLTALLTGVPPRSHRTGIAEPAGLNVLHGRPACPGPRHICQGEGHRGLGQPLKVPRLPQGPSAPSFPVLRGGGCRVGQAVRPSCWVTKEWPAELLLSEPRVVSLGNERRPVPCLELIPGASRTRSPWPSASLGAGHLDISVVSMYPRAKLVLSGSLEALVRQPVRASNQSTLLHTGPSLSESQEDPGPCQVLSRTSLGSQALDPTQGPWGGHGEGPEGHRGPRA